LGGKFDLDLGVPVRTSDGGAAPKYNGQEYFNSTDSSLNLGLSGAWVKIKKGGAGLGTVTSVNATATGALTVLGGPITSAGTLNLTWTGTATQMVLGDGTLATISDLISGEGFLVGGDTVNLSYRIDTLSNFLFSGGSAGSLIYNNGVERVGNEVHALYLAPIWDANRIQGFYVDETTPCDQCTLIFDGSEGVYHFGNSTGTIGSPGTRNLYGDYGIIIDSTTNVNAYTIFLDTTLIATRDYVNSLNDRFGLEDALATTDRQFAVNGHNFSLIDGTTDYSGAYAEVFVGGNQISISSQAASTNLNSTISSFEDGVQMYGQNTSTAKTAGFFAAGSTGIATVSASDKIEITAPIVELTTLPSYADNAAAIAGGLTVGMLYRNGDVVQIVH
jgi:hypothetical protein